MKKKILYIIIMIIVLMITYKLNSMASTVKVKADNVNLREEASTDSKVLDKIDIDAKVELISEDGEWSKIKYKDKEGYIKTEFIGSTVKMAETTTEEASEPAETTGNVNSGKIKVRILPTINSNVITELENSDNIEVISETNNWKFIQTDEISGWIAKTGSISSKEVEEIVEAIEEEEEEEEEQEVQEEAEEENEQEKTSDSKTYEKPVTMYVNASSIYLRKKPTTESDAITSLIRNTDVKVVGEEDGWYRVEHDGQEGYIRKDLLSEEKSVETSRNGENVNRNQQDDEEDEEAVVGSNSTELGQKIVDYAYEFMGCPYVYGASGPNSFDCSGFTSYVYKHFGYSLERSAAGQASIGVEVSQSELQLGDIILFLDYKTMDKIGHVGIYIGDGKFIHASSGSGYCVKTSTFLSGSYKTRYAGARRII